MSGYDRRTVLRGLGTTAAVGLGALAGCAGSADSRKRVEMAEMRFAPETVTVGAGTTVRWENTSDVGHTVTAYGDAIPGEAPYFASGGFESEKAARNEVKKGLVAPGGTYEHTFDHSGKYEYFCIPHESSGMVGTVRVR